MKFYRGETSIWRRSMAEKKYVLEYVLLKIEFRLTYGGNAGIFVLWRQG